MGRKLDYDRILNLGLEGWKGRKVELEVSFQLRKLLQAIRGSLTQNQPLRESYDPRNGVSLPLSVIGKEQPVGNIVSIRHKIHAQQIVNTVAMAIGHKIVI